jgi:threonine dehydratase
VGLEILEQVPDVRTVVVCTGGGGLLAGIAVAIKSLRPEVRIVGVQATGAAAYPPSLRVGHPVSLESMTTMADGLKVGRPGDLPFALVQRYVDEIRTVDEEALSRALLLCLERAKLVVEPAGAASLASLLDLPAGGDPALPTPIVAVLSGGNVDPLLLLRIIRHGLASAGRYLSLRLRIPDRPGALAKLLTEVGDAEANVLEVEHVRIDPRLRVDEVGVALQLETRGQAHCDEVVQRLLEHGYELLPL